MKKYSLSIRQDQFKELKENLIREDGHENAAYLFCNISHTAEEVRLITKEIYKIEEEHIIERSPTRVRVKSDSFVKAMAKAEREKLSLILVHVHPNGLANFSNTDNEEEENFFKTAYIRAPEGVHGSMVLVKGQEHINVIGRAWFKNGTFEHFYRIRVVGGRLNLFDKNQEVDIPAWANRQILAFGPEMQKVLKTLHVGVVGAGGTGSSTTEQLIRLGVGHITSIDEQDFEDTNVNRLFGSRLSDADQPTPKVDIMERLALEIGAGTVITKYKGSVCDAETIKKLKSCDIVFGCTDDFLGRMLLNRLVFWYYIPVIDTAVLIDSEEEKIKEIIGRVTLLFPGSACLTCRKRISDRRVIAQIKKRNSPEEYKELVKEGYIPELDVNDPSVIMFTNGIASRAVSEFMNMISGFMGNHRTATEIVERFHIPDLRKNSVQGENSCLCNSPDKWGNGDEARFLGMI